MKKKELNIYISYTWDDKELADQVSGLLKDRGINSSLSKEKSIPDEPIDEYIKRMLEKSNYLIALLSPHAYSSSWVRKELEIAFFNKKFKNNVLPIFILDPMAESSSSQGFSNLPWILKGMKHFNIDSSNKLDKNAKLIVDELLKVTNLY